MPRSRWLWGTTRKIYEEVGGGWFLVKDVNHLEGFYPGILIAMRGSCLVVSERIDKQNKWRLTTNAIEYVHDKSYRGG